MSRRLHMAYAESFIAISRSVSLQLRCMYIPALLLIISPMFRSHQVAPKTAIQVSTVVRGVSPCKTCEPVVAIERVRCDGNRQHRIQVLAGLTDNSRSVLIPGFCTYLSLSFTPAHSDLTAPRSAPGRRQSATARRRRSGALPPAGISYPTLSGLAHVALARALADHPRRARIRPAQPHRHTGVRHGSGVAAHRARPSARHSLRRAHAAPPRVIRRAKLCQHDQGKK
jgi:hypothetical protein